MKPLTPKQRKTAHLLAAGKTIQAAAAEVCVRHETICIWNRREDFRALVREVEADLLEVFRSDVRRVIGKSLASVEEALDAGHTKMKGSQILASQILKTSHLLSFGWGAGAAGEERSKVEGSAFQVEFVRPPKEDGESTQDEAQ